MKRKRITERIRGKLSSKKGDSIAEVLIALLISSLALVMLASMINSSANMIISSKKKMNSYYSESASFASPSVDDGTEVIIAVNSVNSSYKVKYYTPNNPDFPALQSVVSFEKKNTN